MGNKRVLITGASGFIGACLARDLAGHGDEVHLFLRSESKMWRLQGMERRFRIHNVDITDADAVKSAVSRIEPETVYHLATYGAYPHQKDIKLSVETNVLGTMNLVNACSGVKSFINVSSSSEYGIKTKPMKESDVLEPNSIYGITKAASTLYCLRKAQEEGMPITIFRIFAAYGYYEDQARLIPSVIVPFLRNQSPKLSSPNSVRDFIFVEDIIDAFKKAAQTPAARGEILNLGTGKQRTVRDVAEIARKLTGSRKEVIWGAVQKKRQEPKKWVADMSKTARILKWKPKHTLEQGMEKTVSWFKKTGMGTDKYA